MNPILLLNYNQWKTYYSHFNNSIRLLTYLHLSNQISFQKKIKKDTFNNFISM